MSDHHHEGHFPEEAEQNEIGGPVVLALMILVSYTPQMADIVKYVEQLNELDTDDIEPMLGGLTAEGEATLNIREDVAKPSLGQTAALSEAPSGVAGHFQVPKVFN